MADEADTKPVEVEAAPVAAEEVKPVVDEVSAATGNEETAVAPDMKAEEVAQPEAATPASARTSNGACCQSRRPGVQSSTHGQRGQVVL
jgi:hypothetical protein